MAGHLKLMRRQIFSANLSGSKHLTNAIFYVKHNPDAFFFLCAAAYQFIKTRRHKLHTCQIMVIVQILAHIGLEIGMARTDLFIDLEMDDKAPLQEIQQAEADLATITDLHSKAKKLLLQKNATNELRLQASTTSSYKDMEHSCTCKIKELDGAAIDILFAAAALVLVYNTSPLNALISDSQDATPNEEKSESAKEAAEEPEPEAEPEAEAEVADVAGVAAAEVIETTTEAGSAGPQHSLALRHLSHPPAS